MAPGKIEEAVESSLVDLGITYLPIANESLEALKVASFRFGIFGRPQWKKSKLEELPFAIPTTHLPILPHMAQSLDLWPIHIPRNVVFEFEMLETALLLAGLGQAVLHCPDFVVTLFNKTASEKFKLDDLPFLRPNSITKQEIFLLKRRDHPEDILFKKLAKRLRVANS